LIKLSLTVGRLYLVLSVNIYLSLDLLQYVIYKEKGDEMQKLEAIAKDQGIDDISDAYGKTLLLQCILKSMPKDDANMFMYDTLTMLSDEIDAFEVEGYDDGCNQFDYVFGGVPLSEITIVEDK